MALRGTTNSAPAASSLSNAITYSGPAIQVGDLILLITMQNPGGTGNSFTDPSGFTPGSSLSPALGDILLASVSTLHIAVKIAGAGDTGTPSYTTSVNNFSGYWVQHLRVYSGRVNSSIAAAFNNQVATAQNAGPATPFTYSLTGLTALAGDDVVAIIGAQASAGGTSSSTYTTTISSFSNSLAGYNSTNTNFPSPLFSLDEINVSAGATGTLSANVSATNATAQNVYTTGWVLSLPASAGAPTSYYLANDSYY